MVPTVLNIVAKNYTDVAEITKPGKEITMEKIVGNIVPEKISPATCMDVVLMVTLPKKINMEPTVMNIVDKAVTVVLRDSP
jgi:hypothetical protein